jgi:hypothetical protein
MKKILIILILLISGCLYSLSALERSSHRLPSLSVESDGHVAELTKQILELDQEMTRTLNRKKRSLLEQQKKELCFERTLRLKGGYGLFAKLEKQCKFHTKRTLLIAALTIIAAAYTGYYFGPQIIHGVSGAYAWLSHKIFGTQQVPTEPGGVHTSNAGGTSGPSTAAAGNSSSIPAAQPSVTPKIDVGPVSANSSSSISSACPVAAGNSSSIPGPQPSVPPKVDIGPVSANSTTITNSSGGFLSVVNGGVKWLWGLRLERTKWWR